MNRSGPFHDSAARPPGQKTFVSIEQVTFRPEKGSECLREDKSTLPLSGIKPLFFGSYALLLSVNNSSATVKNAYGYICSLFFSFFYFICNYKQIFFIKTGKQINDSFNTFLHVYVMFMFSSTVVAVEQADFFLRNPV